MTRTRPYREALLEALADPIEAAHYLNAAILDSHEMFLKALKNVAQARRNMTNIAKQAGVTRESLYRSLSDEGNPTLDTLNSVLEVLGLKIAVEPIAKQPIPPPSGQRPATAQDSTGGQAVYGLKSHCDLSSLGSVLPMNALVFNIQGSPSNTAGFAARQHFSGGANRVYQSQLQEGAPSLQPLECVMAEQTRRESSMQKIFRQVI
jgi:probable addiction module antidote protein